MAANIETRRVNYWLMEIDPSKNRKAQKSAQTEQSENSFEAIAREWFAKHSPDWADTHSKRVIRRLEREVFPWVGGQPISGIPPLNYASSEKSVFQKAKFGIGREP
uniref:Phage integrase central domain-containing protein n=1 Tax=Candidatus Kentrum sp. SD TaxID=2126332 RepID=A0A450YLX4_9GAMM|nr:MAG: hypothetical protein BECKSD772F_GA0070984_101837 [Candidatus Kentron sp. SD]VFK42530.1 MAG: hypothetical protein BECKSD772E_GA0070983_101737 [Candidatus Kentron sp. SD]VFK78168.1 MAG: hypothetical protein BECKSD772D_GA0070982_100835 [Candidatus Kentron sp. SD]